MLRGLFTFGLRASDVVGFSVTFLSASWMETARRALHRLPLTKRLVGGVGVYPILHHYYEPLVLESDIRVPLADERNILGLYFNISRQLESLREFGYNNELVALPYGEG